MYPKELSNLVREAPLKSLIASSFKHVNHVSLLELYHVLRIIIKGGLILYISQTYLMSVSSLKI